MSVALSSAADAPARQPLDDIPAEGASHDATSLLAWARWQLHMPPHWRPLKLMGDPKKGMMMVGDSMEAFFSIQWEQQKIRNVSDGEAWAQSRLKRHGLHPDPSPPAADRFSAAVWAKGVQFEEGKKTTFWFGYSQPANLLIGLKVNGVLPEHQRDIVVQRVMPTLQASAADKETTWSMHDVSLVSPAGFRLTQRHLFAGDVALEFEKGSERLLLRQVYPGDLAIERRAEERWLLHYPFKENRKLRSSSVEISWWRHPQHRDLSGVRRHAWKRYAFPFGGVRPRWSHALVVHDTTLNRLLIAEHMAPSKPDERVVEQAIAQMNRPLREGR